MAADIESVRANERWKGLAGFGDNAALGFFAAGIAHGLGDARLALWSLAGVLLGVVFLWISWHIRGLIQRRIEVPEAGYLFALGVGVALAAGLLIVAHVSARRLEAHRRERLKSADSD